MSEDNIFIIQPGRGTTKTGGLMAQPGKTTLEEARVLSTRKVVAIATNGDRVTGKLHIAGDAAVIESSLGYTKLVFGESGTFTIYEADHAPGAGASGAS